MTMSTESTGPEAQAATDATENTTYTREQYAALEGQIKELRRESGGYRTSLRETESRLSAFQDGLTKEDAAKLRGELSSLSDRLTAAEARAIDADIKGVAREKGFADPTDALALIDRTRLQIKDGEATNVGALLEEVLKTKPHLKGATGTVDAGARGKAGTGGFDGNAAMRRMLGR